MRHTGIKATREGLIGRETASGYVIDRIAPFLSLPSSEALNRFVQITNPANGKSAIAWVAEIGPWNGGDWKNPATGKTINTDDDAYVLGGARPQSESGTDKRNRKTNGAGIDLGERIWNELGLPVKAGSALVEWEFLICH